MGVKGLGIPNKKIKNVDDKYALEVERLMKLAGANNMLNAVILGVDNTGETDTSNKLQEAINLAISTNKDLYLPAGNYTLNSIVSITASIKLIGAGKEKTILTNTLNGGKFNIKSDNVTISDLSFVDDPLNIVNADNLLLSNISINGGYTQVNSSVKTEQCDGIPIIANKDSGVLNICYIDSNADTELVIHNGDCVFKKVNGIIEFGNYRTFGKCLFNYGGYDVSDNKEIEDSARILANFDLIVGGGPLHTFEESDERTKQYKIVCRAKEINPNMKFFWYIGIASTRNGGEIGDNGMYDPSSEDTPIMSKTEIMQHVLMAPHIGGSITNETNEDGLYLYTGGIAYDGIFWDEFGMDTEQAVVVQGFESIAQKGKFVINYARKYNLCSFVNGWSTSCYVDLTEDDFFCLESNETRCSLTNDNVAYWMNASTSDRLYQYYKTDYATIKAKMVSLSYIQDNNTDEEAERIMTWCVYNTLIQGGHYVSVLGSRPLNWAMPKNVEMFRIPDGTEYNTISPQKGIYNITVNGHTLQTRRQISGDELGGQKICNESTLKSVYIDIDGKTIQNDFSNVSEYAYKTNKRIAEVETEWSDWLSSPKRQASIYHRMMIDDWEQKLIYTNLITDNYFNTFIDAGSSATTESSDLNARSVKLVSNVGSGAQYSQTFTLDALKYAGKTLEIGIQFNKLNGIFGVSGFPTEQGYYNFSTSKSVSSVIIPEWVGDVYIIKIPEDLESDMSIKYYWNTNAVGDVLDIAHMWIYDINEFAEDVTKPWYTDIMPDMSTYTAFSNVVDYDVTMGDNNHSFSLQYKENPEHGVNSGIQWNIDKNKFVEGKTYEIGCSEFITNCGNDVAFRINFYGYQENWFPKSKITTSTIFGDIRPCLLVTIPEGANIESVSINIRTIVSPPSTTVDGVTNYYYVSIKDFYIYDISEEVILRGIDPTNSLMQICRVTEEKLLKDTKLISNAMYITDVGRVFFTNFSGEIKTEINSGSGEATNAETATRLETARNINGVAFDGTKDITITDDTKLGKNETATSATKLATARIINGVAFDGTEDVTIEDSTKLGKDETAKSSNKLETARNIGLSCSDTTDVTEFDGTKNVTIPVTAMNFNGRNLLVGTKIQDRVYGNTIMPDLVDTGSYYKGSKVFTTIEASSNIGFGMQEQLVSRNLVNVGDTFTYSVYAKTDDTTENTIVFYTPESDDTNTQALTTNWKQYKHTFVVTQAMLDNTTTPEIGFKQSNNCSDGKFVYWSCPKLEYGLVATDYCPALEDLESKNIGVFVDSDKFIYDSTALLYKSTITIEGMTAETYPMVGLVPANGEEPTEAECDAYNKIDNVITLDGSILLTAKEKPEKDITIVLKDDSSTKSAQIANVADMINKIQNLQNKVGALETALSTEKSNRTAADTVIQSNIELINNGLDNIIASINDINSITDVSDKIVWIATSHFTHNGLNVLKKNNRILFLTLSLQATVQATVVNGEWEEVARIPYEISNNSYYTNAQSYAGMQVEIVPTDSTTSTIYARVLHSDNSNGFAASISLLTKA